MQYLYLIRCQQYYKIGVASDVQSRLAQLSTGNPFELEVLSVYGFANAEPIERALHQRFTDARRRGEWFELSEFDREKVDEICNLLGGAYQFEDATIGEEEIEQAEEIQKEVFDTLDKWDFAAMFADGWRMERTTNGRHTGEGSRYWCWRKGNASKGKKYIYGGVLSNLPHSIEEMRRIYDQKGNGNE